MPLFRPEFRARMADCCLPGPKSKELRRTYWDGEAVAAECRPDHLRAYCSPNPQYEQTGTLRTLCNQEGVRTEQSGREYLAVDEAPCKMEVHLKEFKYNPSERTHYQHVGIGTRKTTIPNDRVEGIL